MCESNMDGKMSAKGQLSMKEVRACQSLTFGVENWKLFCFLFILYILLFFSIF